MTSAAYTPLESLLLFQALRVDGVQSVDFNKISNDLQRIPLVTGDRSYDATRLSADALKDLYLRLLKEEVRRDLDAQLARDGDDVATNGNASPGSRKRKAPSPSLPTVHEAEQHSHLIPQLVTRLYARYRENVVRHIREQEERYDAAGRECEEIKAGKWDERLQKQHAASATSSPKTVSAAPPGPPAAIRRDHVQTPTSANASPTSPRPPQDVNPPPKRYSQAKIDAVINHGPEPPIAQGNHRRTSSNTILPPLSEMAPQSPRFGIPPRMPSSHGVHNSPHPVHAAPYSPHHAHPGSAMGSPLMQQNLSRPSSSPRPILPPPPGMKLNQPPAHLPGSPNMHGPPPNMPPQQHYQQSPQQYAAQHRLSTGGAPPQQRSYPPPHGAPHMPTSGYYSPQQPQYQDRRTSYATPQPPPPLAYQHPHQAQHPPHHQQHQPPHHAPHAGGYMLPPFQGTTQDPTKTPHHQVAVQQHTQRGQQTPQYAARPLAYNQNVPSGPATAPRLQPQPQPHQRLMSDIVAALATPPRPIARPLWKSERKPRPAQTPGSPKRPAIEPISPPKPREPSPARQPPPTSMPEPAEPASAQPRRGGRKSARQVRENSVASLTVDGSLRATRSQSVSSVAVSEGRPASRRLVKNEPSTPADLPGDADEAERTIPKRTRRGTLTQGPTSSKRKRNTPELDDEPEPRKNTITATRNFQKMSSTIMNDIVSNKYGSRFANPVNEKQAEGYREIIFRPQDLKSIRGMISHGTRAIATATTAETGGSPSATPSRAAESTVELERSVDLMPPKGIVNGAQLEREVMRMLANAVMFNPGEDGMVMDTREMFEDVEAKMAEWRGAEREEEVEEVEEVGKGKRRKV